MKVTESMQAPFKGKRFKVNLQTIDLNLFLEPREDSNQERTRQIIVEALAIAQSNPKYTKPFTTIIPEKDWPGKYVFELEMFCYKFNGHIADWVEQSLEWAQKISNGVSWQELCNDSDICEWYRLVAWKYNSLRLIGGAKALNTRASATNIIAYPFRSDTVLSDTVPLIVVYD